MEDRGKAATKVVELRRGPGSLIRALESALLVTVLTASGVLSGCAGFVNGAKTVIQAAFQLNPTSVNFGNVGVGKQSTQTVAISNTGNTTVSITQAMFSNPQFSLPGATFPMSMAAGQSSNLTVAVTPSTAGTVSGTLTVMSSNVSSPAVVNLSATAVAPAPQITVSSSTVQFGLISMGSTGNASLTVSNTGGSDLTISAVALTGAEFNESGITTPKTISAGQSAVVGLSFQPKVAGAASATLAITSNDPNNPSTTVSLGGTGSAPAGWKLQANPASLSFGNVPTGSSATQQIAVTNTGTAPVQITSLAATGTGISVNGIALPITVNPSETVTLTVVFAPTVAGSVTGSVTLGSTWSGTLLTIPVSGSAGQAGLGVAPASFDFGSVVDGQTKSQNFTLTNTGSAPLTISQLAVSGAGYSATGLATPTTLAAGASATFTGVFAPTTAGSLSGAVTVSSNASNSPATISLNGTGNAASVTISANPSSLSFGNVNAGGSSSKSVTLTNSGNASVTISQVTIGATDTSTSGLSLPLTLAPGQSGTMNVTFSPKGAETVSGNVTVASTQGASAVIAVSGTGIQAALSVTPASVAFGNAAVGSTTAQTIQLSNTGNGVLTITQASVTGTGFSTSGLSLPLSINPGQASSFSAQFQPTTAGATGGSITITSNAASSPSVVALSGTGVATSKTLSFSASSVSYGNVNTGSSATQVETVTNTGNANVQISQITVSGTSYSLTGASTPVTLSPSQSTAFSINFTPTAAGISNGSVTVTSDASGSPFTIPLSGTGMQPALSIAPGSFAFGSVVDGQTKSQNFTLTNTGNAPLTISQLAASGAGYSVSGLATPATVTAGASVTFNAVFAPATVGSLSGSVSVVSNAPNSPATISMSGTGVAATTTLSANPASLSFGNVNAGSSATKQIILTNTGTAAVQISAVGTTGAGMSTSGITTPLTLNPSATATLNVVFAPTAAGNVTGNVIVTSNATGSPLAIPVSGTGVQAALSVTPSTANLGNVTVGGSNSQTIQLKNTGNGVLTITQANVTGTGFSTSGLSLPLSINPGQTSNFNAVFQPAAAGAVSGSISIVSNAATSPSVIALSGTGVTATATLSLSASNVSFGNVNTGSSATQGETITNTGNSNVQISQIAVSGTGYSLSGANVPVTLTPTQSMTFNIIFSPTAAGSASGSVTVTSNAVGSPATITLSGSGVQATTHTVSLSWTASTSTVAGYNVYRTTTSGTGYAKLNGGLVPNVNYTDSAVTNGTTYYYVTTAVDSGGNESTYSNEATAVIP